MAYDTLVLDTSAFLRPTFHTLYQASALVTHPAVVKEATERKWRGLPLQVRLDDYIPEYYRRVVKAKAKETGDIAKLSITDITVIALALKILKAADEDIQPESSGEGPTSTAQETVSAEEENPFEQRNLEEAGGVDAVAHDKGKTSAVEETADATSKAPEPVKNDPLPISYRLQSDPMVSISEHTATAGKEELTWSDDGEGEWITPSRGERASSPSVPGARKSGALNAADRVACVTSDFAMQNVLVSLKIPCLSVDGLHIKSISSFVLRCYSCFRIFHQHDLHFCKNCGNSTLVRVRCSTDPETGKLRYHLHRDFKPNIKGRQRLLPSAQGGREPDVIVRGDQKEYQRAVWKKNKQERVAEGSDGFFEGAGLKGNTFSGEFRILVGPQSLKQNKRRGSNKKKQGLP